jgi:magnesium transporter
MDPTRSDPNAYKTLLNDIASDIVLDNHEALKEKLEEIHPAETANVLEAMPPKNRQMLWQAVPMEQEAEVLAYISDEVRTSLVEAMDEQQLLSTTSTMDTATLSDVIKTLPDELGESVIQALDEDHRNRLETLMTYEEDSAGRLMNTNVISVRQDVTLAVVLRWLRRHSVLPKGTDSLLVIDEHNLYLGKLELSDVLISDPNLLVADKMKPDADTVSAKMHKNELAALFERRDLMSVAVLDETGHLVGRITIDEILYVIRELADTALLKTAGLQEDEDLFAPVVPSAKRRGIWLGINLITVFIAAWVIGRFEEALDKIVALAVLMPIVASMGGIAGSQTLTLTIRGLALDQIARSNIRWLTIKEILVGTLNGLVWAIVVALVSYFWFNNIGLALIIAFAMILNLFAASLSGVMIPLALNRLGIDPALSGAVILTTVTDVIGFLSFLGLATLFLLPG